MILSDPYDFKVLKLLDKRETIDNINKYIAIDYTYIKDKEHTSIKQFRNDYTTLNPVFLYGLTAIEKEITPFNHPIINRDAKWIAMDLRQVVKADTSNNTYTIRNDSEYSLTMCRFILSGLWAINNQSSMYSLKLPHQTFAAWLSENITRKFGLDLSTGLHIKVLAYIYYSKLFTNNFTDDDYNKLKIRLKDDIVAPSIIDEVYSKIDKLEDIEDFCKACYKVTNNVRLEGMNSVVLINILANNWLGLNGKELTLLSLEHPPTWISLNFTSLVLRGVNKSYIAELVKKLDRRGSGTDFTKALQHLIHAYGLTANV